MPLDRAIGPGQRHAGFDGRIVVPEPGGKALQGLQRTGRRPLEPGIELRGLALAHQGRKILGEVDGLSDLGRLRVELGELLRLGLWALRRTPQHQPGRPARGERGASGLRHDGQRLAAALAAGWDALGLADAADIGRDAAIAARVPARLDLLKELDGGVAPGVPALQEIRLIGIEDTPPIVAPVLPARARSASGDTARWCDNCGPTCAAMAAVLQPWRCKAHTAS